MQRNMRKWLKEVAAAPKKHALPILSFPSIQMMNITVKDLIADSETQASGMALLAERFPSLAAVSMMDLSVEAERFGSTIRVTDDEVPTVVGRIVESEEDADALQIPDASEGRTGMYVEAVRRAAERIADRPVFAGCIGPFSLAGRLMDVSEIMYSCYDEPETVHKVMEKTTEFIIRYANAFKKAGANGIMMAEPLTGMLSPALSAEFSCPYVKKIRDAVASDDFLFLYHNCGDNVIPMLDSILTINADAYHFGNAIDMVEMMEKLPADVIAMGNLDPAGVLRYGTPESVFADTTAMLQRLSKYPNYIPSSGCDIPPATPLGNVEAFFNAVEQF